MAIHASSTPMPAPQRALHPVDIATAAVLARLPIPFAHRPCAHVAAHRTADELLDEIGREIARQAALPNVWGSHGPA